MLTRRKFMRDVARLAGAAGIFAACPEAVQRAFAIEPAAGSTYLDAEHVVILMQENRAFDHAFGTLRGVRGFNDPRAITLPDGNPVWVQPNAAGEHYLPFRLDIKDTKATWMGSLPHGWTDQQDARNHGRYDRWLRAKRSGHRAYAAMPLTLGYYTRADIPFYYALADAFTICDQHFCSSLTGTTPNRLHLWTGTIRERQSADAPANVRNENVDYERWASWPTFPERLEEHGISWKIYQNELTLESGLDEDRRRLAGQLRRQSDRMVHPIQRPVRPDPSSVSRQAPEGAAGRDRRVEEETRGQPGTGRSGGETPNASPISAPSWPGSRPNAANGRRRNSTPYRRARKAFTHERFRPTLVTLRIVSSRRSPISTAPPAAASRCRRETSCNSFGGTSRTARCRRYPGSSRPRHFPTIRRRRGTGPGTLRK